MISATAPAASAPGATAPAVPKPASARFGKTLARARSDARQDNDAPKNKAADKDAKPAPDPAASGSAAPAQSASPDPLAGLQALIAAIAGTMPTAAAPPAAVAAAAAPAPPAAASAIASPPANDRQPAAAKAAVAHEDADGAAEDSETAPAPLAPGWGEVLAAVTPAGASADGDALGGTSASPAPLAEAAVARHLDLAADGAWLDRLAHDIVQSADTSGQLRFSLAPAHLGRLDVALAQTGDGTSIRLTAETREAHRIVSDAQPRLVAEARAQGLTVSETSVDLGGSGGNGYQPQAFGNQSGAGGDQPQRTAAWPEPSASAPAIEPAQAAPDADELYA